MSIAENAVCVAIAGIIGSSVAVTGVSVVRYAEKMQRARLEQIKSIIDDDDFINGLNFGDYEIVLPDLE